MQKEIKNINLCSMWLAIVIFFFHIVIPHQQHLNSGFEPDCQLGTMDDSSGDTPIDCQLFKYFSLEKIKSSSNKNSDDNTHQVTSVKAEFQFQRSENINKRTIFFSTCGCLANIFFQENIPVRGSPFIV